MCVSKKITRPGYGCKFKSGTTINHLYMDKIKLYAKSEWDSNLLIHLIQIYSEDSGMSFGLEKCGWMMVERGKAVKTDGAELPAGHIADIQSGYKYFGIP